MAEKKRVAWLFVLPGLLGVLAFYMIPFLMSLYYTFTKGISEVQFVGFQNFTELFKNPAFSLALKNTLIFLCVGVPIVTILSLTLSLMMSQKLYKFPRWAMLSPMIVPVASAMMGWQVILGDQGIINQWLNAIGQDAIAFFGEAHAMKVMLFIFVIKNTGYMLIIFTGAISSLAKEYEEAFVLDSNSRVKYALKIVVPLIAPIIFFVVILSIINSFQMFRDVYAIYGNFPPSSVYLLQYFMNNNFYKLNYQRLSTAAFILVLGISFIISLFLRYQDKKIHS